MKTSEAGADLIKRYEGLRLRVYRDSAGIWTIGYGRTRGVRGGMAINEAQAGIFLKEDLYAAESAVHGLGIQSKQSQFDALVCFTFNLGPGWTRGSGLRTKLRANDWPRVPMEMAK